MWKIKEGKKGSSFNSSKNCLGSYSYTHMSIEYIIFHFKCFLIFPISIVKLYTYSGFICVSFSMMSLALVDFTIQAQVTYHFIYMPLQLVCMLLGIHKNYIPKQHSKDYLVFFIFLFVL